LTLFFCSTKIHYLPIIWCRYFTATLVFRIYLIRSLYHIRDALIYDEMIYKLYRCITLSIWAASINYKLCSGSTVNFFSIFPSLDFKRHKTHVITRIKMHHLPKRRVFDISWHKIITYNLARLWQAKNLKASSYVSASVKPIKLKYDLYFLK